MKYNIALCFYGEARNWKTHGYESILKFKKLPKEEFNVDVYFHLWDNITRRIKNIKDLIKKNINLNNACVIESSLRHKELLELYKPVNYKIENKDILDEYIDKFKPSNIFLSTEEIKQAIKYSNTPCFSQFYSMSQCYDVVREKEKYNLIIILKTDCLFDNKSIINKTIKFYCKYITERNSLLVERMSFVPSCKEPWLYHVYMLGNSNVFSDIFKNFPKIPIGMGMYHNKKPIWKGSSHAELANYILNYTTVNRVWPILHQSHPHFVGKASQFKLETYET